MSNYVFMDLLLMFFMVPEQAGDKQERKDNVLKVK